MSDHIKGVYVLFDENIGRDYALELVSILKHIKGVLDVQPEILCWEDYAAKTRAKKEIFDKILGLFKSFPN